MPRRAAKRVSILALVWVAAGCSRVESTATSAHVIEVPGPSLAHEELRAREQSLADGVAFLAKHQSSDGAWRSEVYASFRSGTALTPLVVCALQEAGSEALARRKGNEYLAKMVKPDGTIDEGEDGIDYPVYTAAISVIALSHPDNKDLLKARDAWLKYLLDRQLTEKLGWNREEKQYGGWGYCRLMPKKPKPNEFAPPLVESNLSATVFALDALKAAGVKDKEVYEKALAFVRRCQNEDGGFHFIYDDPVRNKAGIAEQTAGRPPRFHSYGSTTADGLRSLILCSEPEKARIEAAKKWLRRNFRADSHPGEYANAHEPNREAVYYYYAASVARTLRLLDDFELPDDRDWRAELTKELVKRQRRDGSWANPVELVRENDPIVATASAIIALANCRP
jgi:hypothetical protein